MDKDSMSPRLARPSKESGTWDRSRVKAMKSGLMERGTGANTVMTANMGQACLSWPMGPAITELLTRALQKEKAPTNGSAARPILALGKRAK